ncbi:hypothetical protein P7H25_08690 [Paenibacillus larvae]|nr:hypothetical protein [Paenibacillus larvae]MDT2255697.1 hypothetical protein [Paenibacillus larvae]
MERLAGRNEGQGGGKFGVTSVNGGPGDVILMAKHVGAPSINDLRAYALKGEPAGQHCQSTFLNVGTHKQAKLKGPVITRTTYYVHLMALAQGLN